MNYHEVIQKAEALTKQAKAQREYVNEHFANFLEFIVDEIQTERIGPMIAEDEKSLSLGIHVNNEGSYISLSIPTITTEGLIKMARIDHQALNDKNQSPSKLFIHPPVIKEMPSSSQKESGEIGKHRNLIHVTVESELLGSVTGTSEWIEEKQAFEVAHSKAIDKAFRLLGYGLIGQKVSKSPDSQNGTKEPIPTNESNPTVTQKSLQYENTPVEKRNSNQPATFKVTVLGAPVFRPDGSSTFQAICKNQHLAIHVPKERKRDADNIAQNQVLELTALVIKNGTELQLEPNSQLRLIDMAIA